MSLDIAHFSEIFTENSKHVAYINVPGIFTEISENVLQYSVNIHCENNILHLQYQYDMI